MTGTPIGPYSIIGRLGAGGMGEVYLAEDPRLGRRVALKTVSSSSLHSFDARASLLREARAAAKLNHPHIAAVYDVLERPDGLHIVMEYVEGESAAALIRRTRVPVAKVVDIGIQLMDALDEAHAHGILHRDIKPGNVMITPQGRVKVLDFGLAKVSNPSAPLGNAESAAVPMIVGTLGYMAPERLLHREADHRADLYAAGALLYEMLTGRLPYAEKDYAAAVLAMTEETPPPPDELNPDVPRSLGAVVMRALERDSADRFGSAAEFRRDLVAVAGELTEGLTGPADSKGSSRQRRTAWSTRTFRRVSGAAAATAVAVGAWVVWTLVSQQPPAQAFGARDWVLVADFDNRTNEPLFDHTLRTALETAVQQSKYVNVFPRTQVFDSLRRMRVADGSAVDEARALEIGRRENIKVVLAGSALASGATIQIGVRAIETSTGSVLFAETRRFTRKEELFDQVDSLALAMREKLGEGISRAGSQTQPLARVTTASLEALHLYSRASDEFARGALEKSRDLLLAALERDPDFAMAHVRLGSVFTSLGQFERTQHHYGRAYELRAHVTERESYAIQSTYYELRDEYEKARDSWRVLTQLYPDDLSARLELAIALHETGEFELAVPELRHVLALNPFHGSAHSRLVLVLARINRADEAIKSYELAVSKGVGNPFLLWGLGLARMSRFETDLAREAFARLEASGGTYHSLAGLYLAQLESYEGRLKAARERLEAGLAIDRKLGNVAYELVRRYFLGRVLLLQGERTSAEQQARLIMAREKQHLLAQNVYQAGTLFVRVGNLSAAQQLLKQLDRMHQEMPTPFHRTFLDTLHAEVAFAGGNLSEAETAFESAANGYPASEPHEGLALIHTRRNEWKAAREEWSRVIALRGNILQVGFAADWPLAHLSQARACRQEGDHECAERHYDTFVKLWQRGDPVAVRREAEDELRQVRRARFQPRPQ